MVKIEITEKYKAYTEEEAKDFIEKMRHDSAEEGYILKKAGYEYKTKKTKGECWITTCTKVFNDIWEEIE